jgi:N-glycosylase/DNA lyase
MSVFYFLLSGAVVERVIPSPEEEVLPGVVWGGPETVFTPCYWMTQYWMREEALPPHQRIGESFEEEVVACLLGGYGIPAEVGIAAFNRLRDRSLISTLCSNSVELAEALHAPLTVCGRQVKYRFWLQKAQYVAAALDIISKAPPPTDSSDSLRAYLLKIPGIGPKTASWIVRNWLASNDVAILDIHVVRAGMLMGLYSESDKVTEHYFRMERRFLSFASAINVPAARLDALIWAQMRNAPLRVTRDASRAGTAAQVATA